MSETVMAIVRDEIIPLYVEGTCAGFATATVFILLSYGIFKSISLLSINYR